MGDARPELAGEEARRPAGSRDIFVHLRRGIESQKGIIFELTGGIILLPLKQVHIWIGQGHKAPMEFANTCRRS
jgi:hypothetical protein